MDAKYSVAKISEKLIQDIKNALQAIKSHGSVEIFVQQGTVTQITTRSIKKTVSNGSSASRK